MLYYVYYDGYGRAKKAIDENELAKYYENDKNKFFEVMSEMEKKTKDGFIAGHIGTVKCNTEKELNEFLNSLGDEIEGLYEGHMDARPYNF